MINKIIEQKLNLKNVKPTSMRMLVMDYFEGIDTAVSLGEVENHFDYSDMSTLYRTLKTFVKHNILHTIDDGTGKIKYAKCMEGCICAIEDLHYHFHCLTCKKTICLTEQSIPAVILPKNYLMTEANMVIKGVCSECRK